MVSVFQETLDQIVVLAVFLPVLAGQCGNLGAQSLAVTIRGMTLGELRGVPMRRLLAKETWLGLLNGIVTGTLAGMGMYFAAHSQANPLGPPPGLQVIPPLKERQAFAGSVARGGDRHGLQEAVGNGTAGRETESFVRGLNLPEGIEPEDLSIPALEKRLGIEPIREVILALPTDVEGDATSSYLARRLAGRSVRISRLAHGLPVGSALEYADELTLSRALEGRRAVPGTESDPAQHHD